jgi:SAM-dependent MidA family methyltransferase
MKPTTDSTAGGLDYGEAHSRRLSALIRQEAVDYGGLLPFDRFMELALYAPGFGYYVSGARKIGPGGDFVTAPEISPLFGACIAAQCGEVLDRLDGGDILEIGAGSGALAVQVLAALERSAALPGRYLILELSPDLKERQRGLVSERLPRLLERVHWLERLPESFRGVVLANEVLDAMPVHRFRVAADGAPLEVFVTPAGDGWREVCSEPESPGLARAVRALQAQGLAAEPGFGSEINLRLGPWLAALAASVERGLTILIDYGYPRGEYYHADRGGGTLMCHHRHRAHDDPYRNLGLQDITAHVDFTAVAELGREAGFGVAGYTTQAHFLLGCGLDRMLAEVAAGEEALGMLAGARQLVLPQGMGERFRVLGLEKGVSSPWRGFSVRDLREGLWR